MTAVEKATELYASIGKDFTLILQEYVYHHYVYCAPTKLLLARLHDDYWHVELAIGEDSLKLFLQLMPIHRPYVGWARDLKKKPYRYYQTRTLWRHLC